MLPLRLYAVPVLWLTTTIGILAAPPDVPRDLKVKPGQLVRVTVKGDAVIGTLKNFTDEEAFFGELVSPKGSRQFVFQAPVAQYDKDGKPLPQRATYVLGWWTKGEIEGSSTTITVDTANGDTLPPVPDPKPGPQPDPKPNPVGTAAYLVVVEETSARTPEHAKVLNDLTYWNAVRAKEVKWRFYDKDSPEAVANKYVGPATAKGLPALLTLDKTGVILDVRPLPATTADIDKHLKEYGK
jgi:hypothetical protein